MSKVDHLSTLGRWCEEGVRQFGSDWPKIRTYVESRIDGLPEEGRRRFRGELEALLRQTDGAIPPD